MRSRPSRSARAAFVTALAAGVAMVGASVHGLIGIDRQLAHSAPVVHQQPATGAYERAAFKTDCPAAARGV